LKYHKERKMKKGILLIPLAILLVIGLVVTGCPSSTPESGEVIELDYAIFQPATSLLAQRQTEYAHEIEVRTGGKVKINVHQAGSLLEAPGMYNGVRSGIADMGNGIASYTPGNFPFSEICQLPVPSKSGWSASYAMWDFMQKYQPAEWDEVHLLLPVGPGFDLGCVMLGREPIEKLEDFRGKSIRCNDPDIVNALGGTVKDLPMTDVYDALSKGVVDGMFGSPMPLKSWKFADVCKYVTVNTAPIQVSMVWYDIMNKKAWNSLPADIQETITEVSQEYCGKFGLVWDQSQIDGIEYAQSQGCTIIMLSDEEQQKWVQAIETVIDTRMEKLATKFPEKDVKEAYDYFYSRVEYWNDQLPDNNIIPVVDRIEALD
jgi:TRAP-type C4-dicarboxylate transport system substrate-binding protein